MGSSWRLSRGAGSETAFLPGLEPLLAHEAADPIGAATHLSTPQFVAEAPATVSPAALEEKHPELFDQLGVPSAALALRFLLVGVQATLGSLPAPSITRRCCRGKEAVLAFILAITS
jgi:hypothetical protein